MSQSKGLSSHLMREGFQEKASEPSLKVLIDNACGQDPWMTNPCGHTRSVRVM